MVGRSGRTRRSSRDGPGSSLTTTSAGAPNRSRSRRAIAWAWSWSMAMTSPPASRCVWRISRSCSLARASTLGIHSPSRLERGAQPHRHLVLGQLVLEVGRDHVARRRRPLHLAVDPREVDRAHDAAVAQRVGVAVRVVGVRQVALAAGGVVADERDLDRVAAERGTRQRQPAAGVPNATRTPSPQAFSWPAWWISSRITKPPAESPASFGGGVARGDLLVGGDEAVDVAGEPVARGPVGVELQPEPVGGERPLDLEVAGRRDDDQGARLLGEAGSSAGERERRLAGARAWRRRGSRGRRWPGTVRRRHAARGAGSRSASAPESGVAHPPDNHSRRIARTTCRNLEPIASLAARLRPFSGWRTGEIEAARGGWERIRWWAMTDR